MTSKESRLQTEARVAVVFLIVGLGPLAGALRAGLELRLTTEVTQLYLLEAVPLVLTVRNSGKVSTTYDSRIFREDDVATVVLTRPDGSIRRLGRIHFGAPICGLSPEPFLVTLTPGEVHQLPITLCCDLEHSARPLFVDSGHYSLFVVYKHSESEVRSNSVGYIVLPPPLSEARAFKMLQRMGDRLPIYESHVPSRDGKDRREMELGELASLPESVIYGSYARLRLAEGALKWVQAVEVDREAMARALGVESGELKVEEMKYLQQAEKWLQMIGMDRRIWSREVSWARGKLEEHKANLSRP